ncbi:MAG TPA: hypothetical protein DDY37_05280 [Legionella sp.]|nr:hypothetical protein [Legionella sp.]
MSYKHIKKKNTTQKITKPHCISSELMAGKRFNEIITLCQQTPELTHQDRYMYGYSLLQTQQYTDALIVLWPLYKKASPLLQEDCTSIALHIFSEEHFLSLTSLSTDALHALFLIANHLMPEHPRCHQLKQTLLDRLWIEGNYETLERILRSMQGESPSLWIENASKLAFFQPKKKLSGSASAFIGHILTGSACLVMRNPLYHGDIVDAIGSLVHEMKRLYAQFQHESKQKMAWSSQLFDDFTDYEAGILTRVLQYAVNNGFPPLDVIPTPSYLLAYDPTGAGISQSFLPWLAAQNKSLLHLYHPDTHRAVLWALAGEKLSEISPLLKATQNNPLHPYLRLAVMLRAEHIKKSSLAELVHAHELESEPIDDATALFKQVTIQTVKSILHKKAKTDPSSAFLETLLAFYPFIPNPDIKNSLILNTIQASRQIHRQEGHLNIDPVRKMVRQLQDPAFEEQVEALWSREQACLQFISGLQDTKQSKKIIAQIKTESSLRTHLSFILDTCMLIPAALPGELFFEHMRMLIGNKRINQLIALKPLFDCQFKCWCTGCLRQFRHDVPSVIETLDLPVTRHLDPTPYAKFLDSNKLTPFSSSILSQDDPFKTLDIAFTDSKQMIMKKVMEAIQRAPDQMAVFRHAQSELFNPGKRFLHHYLRAFSHEKKTIETIVDLPPPKTALDKIPFRQACYHAN